MAVLQAFIKTYCRCFTCVTWIARVYSAFGTIPVHLTWKQMYKLVFKINSTGFVPFYMAWLMTKFLRLLKTIETGDRSQNDWMLTFNRYVCPNKALTIGNCSQHFKMTNRALNIHIIQNRWLVHWCTGIVLIWIYDELLGWIFSIKRSLVNPGAGGALLMNLRIFHSVNLNELVTNVFLQVLTVVCFGCLSIVKTNVTRGLRFW